MSHYRCEVIIPPARSEDVEAAIAEILKPFDEDPPGYPKPLEVERIAVGDLDKEVTAYREALENWYGDRRHVFWDWYQIGGRWAGQHIVERYHPEIVDTFNDRMTAMEVTISGVQFGKQELSPASQIPAVDEVWRELFPDSGLDRCPFFQHSNPGNRGAISGDICTVGELGKWTSAERLIIAGPSFDWDEEAKEGTWTLTPVEAEHMVSKEYWNGVSWNETAWDSLVVPHLDAYVAKEADTVRLAVERWSEKDPERMAKVQARYELERVTPEWLAVTVDYHS